MTRLLRQVWVGLGLVVGAFVLSWVVFMPSSDMRGIWRAENGGTILSLGSLRGRLFSETPVSCVRDVAFPAHLKMVELSQGTRFAMDGRYLVMDVDGVATPTRYTRLPALPDTCTTPDPDAPPEQVFAAFRSAIDAFYPDIERHGIDWAARRNPPPGTGPAMTDADLFDLLSRTLEGVADPNLFVLTDLGAISPAGPTATAPATEDGAVQTVRDIIGTPLQPVDLTGLEYAIRPDGVGYVLVRTLGFNRPLGARTEQALAATFDPVAADLAQARAILIDLRFALGGTEDAALAIASHFAVEPRPLFRTAPPGAGTGAEVILRPRGATSLGQPVLVLTGARTRGAAEVLALALHDLPQVTTLGQPTAGSLTGRLGVLLPNGWRLVLPYPPYVDPDGRPLTGRQIAPDVDGPDPADTPGDDPLLRAALIRASGG